MAVVLLLIAIAVEVAATSLLPRTHGFTDVAWSAAVVLGYLVSIALFGLYQAMFLANAGGAWDNAKKIVEVELAQKGSALHDATVVGDTVGDPFKDTSSVAMNPIIKFTTLFGMLALQVALDLDPQVSTLCAVLFIGASLFLVWRSFYKMRIQSEPEAATGTGGEAAASPH